MRRALRLFRSTTACAVFAVSALCAVPVHAAVHPLFATLSGAEEVPPNTSDATGQGVFLYDDVANLLAFNIAFADLSSPETVAHIHGPALPGQNALPVFNLAPGPIKVGIWNGLSEGQEMDLLAGLYYVNIHSEMFPGGEIRGQITAVPEPGTTALLLAGLAAVGMLMRRRMK